MRFKAAVIGAGFMGRTHIEALLRLGNVDIAGVAGGRIEKARELAAAFGVPRVEPDYRTLLSDSTIDTVHICTPNAQHFDIAETALSSGKHVVCEKPLATSSGQACRLVSLARQRGLRHCTNHNLRCYPLVQQMREMCRAGELGEILVVQGTYSQDWLLLDTDWNWRVEASQGGPSRVMADIGSHWCDMAEHVTGLGITSLCADLQTFHASRQQPAGAVDTFQTGPDRSGRSVAVDTEDFGSVLFRMGDRTRGAFTASQVAAGRRNRLFIEVFGSKGSAVWDQEKPDELWLGSRGSANRVMLKDPALMGSGARAYADFPAGHSEGYDDTFKQLFRRFYAAVADPLIEADYPSFVDGFRQLLIVEAELESNRKRTWVEVPS